MSNFCYCKTFYLDTEVQFHWTMFTTETLQTGRLSEIHQTCRPAEETGTKLRLMLTRWMHMI